MLLCAETGRGVRKGCWECKDQLLVQKMVLEEAKAYHRNFSMCWVNLKIKAFDAVSHGWILTSLQCLDLPERLQIVLKPLTSC